MFDVKKVNHRYFEVKLSITNENGEEEKSIDVEVEPPKIKILKRIMGVAKIKDEDAIEELTECVRLLLNKNKRKITIQEEYIDEMDFDEMQNLILEFFIWLGKTKELPN